MTLGLARNTIERALAVELRSAVQNLTPEDVDSIARVVAAAIESNNRQMERDLGWKFAEVERIAAR